MASSRTQSPLHLTPNLVDNTDTAPVHDHLSAESALVHLRRVRDVTQSLKSSNEEMEFAVKKMLRIQAKEQDRIGRTDTMLHAMIARGSRRRSGSRSTSPSPMSSPNRRRSTITIATEASARNSIVDSKSGGVSPESSIVLVSPVPKRPARPHTTESVHQRLYNSAMVGVSPSFRELQRTHKTDPQRIKEINEADRLEQIRRTKEVAKRNKEDLEAVKRLMRGDVDISEFQKHKVNKGAAVRGSKIDRERAAREQAMREAHAKNEVRKMKATNIEEVDEFITRLCALRVMVTLVKSVNAVKHIIATNIKDAHVTRQKWAALVLVRSMPIMWRKFVRKKRLIRLGAAMRIVYMVVHRKRVLERRAVNLIHHFFCELRRDPMLRVSRFLRHVLIATKATRGFIMVRKHQMELVRRQWRAMETFMLLVYPQQCIAEEDIAKIKLYQRWDENDPDSPYNAVPAVLQDFLATDPYFVFLARWRRHARINKIRINDDGLPLMLERFLPPPQYRAPFILDHTMSRQRRIRRAVNNIFNTFMNEKTAARDMMKASKQLRHESAHMDVKRKYPSVNESTKLFEILVEFEETYAPSPFFQILMANTNAALVAKLPPVPFVRTLFLTTQLRLVVIKCFNQMMLNRDLVTMGSSALPPEKALTVSIQELKEQQPSTNVVVE